VQDTKGEKMGTSRAQPLASTTASRGGQGMSAGCSSFALLGRVDTLNPG